MGCPQESLWESQYFGLPPKVRFVQLHQCKNFHGDSHWTPNEVFMQLLMGVLMRVCMKVSVGITIGVTIGISFYMQKAASELLGKLWGS